MRKLLLAAVAAISLTAPAHAVVLTDSITEDIAQAKSFLQQLKSYAQDLQNYVQYVRTAEEAFQIASGLIHDPSLGAVMQLAGITGFDLNSYLPVNPYALMGLTSGYSGAGIGGMLGKLTGLGTLVNTNFAVNQVHQCTSQSFACQMMTQQAYQAAGQTAVAQQIYTDLQNHMQVLQGLRTRAGTAHDAKDVADIQAQIAIETTAIQSMTAQLQAAQAMGAAQRQANDNRSSEFMRRDTEQSIRDALRN